MQVEASETTAGTRFEPVALPTGEGGAYDAVAIDTALRDWVTAPPLRALADASGWEWPAGADTLALLDRLAELSADWDFRKDKERNFIEGTPAEVNGRQIPDGLVIPAARALGLVDASPVAGRVFSHLVVLSGLTRACVNRTHFAAGLLRDGLRAGSVAVLGAHRKLGGAEPEQARELGFGELSDESDVIVAAARQAFGLGEPAITEESESALDPEVSEQFHAAWARYRWDSVEVLIVPSSDPTLRRADTADQLRYWAASPGSAAAMTCSWSRRRSTCRISTWRPSGCSASNAVAACTLAAWTRRARCSRPGRLADGTTCRKSGRRSGRRRGYCGRRERLRDNRARGGTDVGTGCGGA